MSIENTQDPASAELSGLLLLATGDIEAVIGAQEKAGQRQLVHSDRLPADLNGDSQSDFEALGFQLGDPDPADPMFRPATLPAGWRKEGSEHDMWSYVVDELGRRRVGVFYKAAFYDRKAHMNIKSLRAYVTECVYNGTPIVTDATWATRQAVAEAATKEAAYEEEKRQFWAERDDTKYAAEHEAERDKYQAITDAHTD